MNIQQLEREFSYNGVRLADPAPAMTLQQVRDFYANIYPEIVSADIEGPKQIGNKTIYTFRRAVGTKGGANLTDMIGDVAALLQANWLDAGDAEFIKDLQESLSRNEVVKIDCDSRMRLLALHGKHCVSTAA
jgi:PRTRC genetic system protein C